MPTPTTLTDGFLNTRTRLQRLSDARFFSGWVAGFADGHLNVTLPAGCELAAGDRVFVTLNSVHCSATFQATLLPGGDSTRALGLEGVPRFAPPIEDPRYATESMPGTLTLGHRRIEMEIADVSEKGLGGTIDVEVPRGSSVRFEIEGIYGKVGGCAEVRYCRADPTRPGRFRTGLLLIEIGRIDQARWVKMLGAQGS